MTVALPAIQARLGFRAGSLSWVMNAYLIAFGGLLLLSGRLGDLLGRKRMFLAGIALFTLASLACGLADRPWLLVAARFTQGAGAAMASAVTLGMIARLFSQPDERNRAIAGWAFTGAVGASVGLVIGGLLVQYVGWHWIFFVNLPTGLAVGGAGWRALADDRGIGLRAGADAPGAVLATAGVMLAVLAIADHADWWAGPAAAVLLAAFAVRQARLQAAGRAPLLPPRVLGSRAVAGANLAQLLVIGAAMGFQVTVTLYLQRALGYGPAAAGLGLLPAAAVIAAVSLGLSSRLAGRFGPRWPLLAGLVMITVALAVLTQVPARAQYATWLLPPLVVFGAGGGLTLPALAALGLADATDADAGVVSGLFNTTQQVGAAVGVALLTSLAAWRTGGGTSAQALTGGYHLAFAAGAVLAAVSVAVAAALLSPRRRPRPLAKLVARGTADLAPLRARPGSVRRAVAARRDVAGHGGDHPRRILAGPVRPPPRPATGGRPDRPRLHRLEPGVPAGGDGRWLARHLHRRGGRPRPAGDPGRGHRPGGRGRAQRGRAPGDVGRGPGEAARRDARGARDNRDARDNRGARGARPAAFVAVTAVVSLAGVLALADSTRDGTGGTAALDLMGGGPDERPEEYRLADPLAAVPLAAPVHCLHSRADAAVPFAYSERYVAAATAAGGRAALTETYGDHMTLVDPASPDWAVVAGALPGLLGG